LLGEAVEELKARQTGEARKSILVGETKELPSVVLPLDAHIPEEYVPSLNNRLSLYSRLARVEHVQQIEDMAREFKDRFGPLPQPVDNLLYIVKIKVLTAQAEVSSVSTQGKQIVIKPRESVIASVAKQSISKGYGVAVKVGTTQIKLDTRLLGDRWKEVLEEVLSSHFA
jgi:transcription-repair coupling factor (superfamily II helicase)